MQHEKIKPTRNATAARDESVGGHHHHHAEAQGGAKNHDNHASADQGSGHLD